MDPIVDRTAADAVAPQLPAAQVTPAIVDVPGALATHIGDLYAETERQRRHERTELMIRRAESIPEA